MFSHYCCSEKVKIKFSHRSKSGYYADNYFYLIKSLSNFWGGQISYMPKVYSYFGLSFLCAIGHIIYIMNVTNFLLIHTCCC